jgi:transposase
VVAAGRLRELDGRIRDMERLLGRKTMEVEILWEALSAARGKSHSGSCRRHHRAVSGESRG